MALQEFHLTSGLFYPQFILSVFKKHETRQKLKIVTKLSITFLVIQSLAGTVLIENSFGASKLAASSVSGLQVGSGKFLLAPVPSSGAVNPQSALTLSMTAKNDYFFLKNFGNYALSYFSMTQTQPSTTIRYCVNQNFKVGSYTKCADNSNAIAIGNTFNLGRVSMNSPLIPGSSYQFSAVSTTTGTNKVSVSISQNDLFNPGGTISNS